MFRKRNHRKQKIDNERIMNVEKKYHDLMIKLKISILTLHLANDLALILAD